MKVTRSFLLRLIKEEMDKLEPTADRAEEAEKDVAPGDMADTVEKQIDFLKVLKIEEARLVKKLDETRARKAAVIAKLTK